MRAFFSPAMRGSRNSIRAAPSSGEGPCNAIPAIRIERRWPSLRARRGRLCADAVADLRDGLRNEIA
jgi:hypothetical protein